MKTLQLKIAALFVLVAAAVLWAIGNDAKHSKAQAALARIHKSASLGGEVDAIEAAAAAEGLESRRGELDGWDQLVVETPVRFGAQNWRLVVLADPESGQVHAYGIRTEDGHRRRPEDAPEDKVSLASDEIWRRHME